MTPPTCKNCIKQCGRNQHECQEHVYEIGNIPLTVTKTDWHEKAIQYSGKFWNGGKDGWLSHDIYIIKRAKEIFEG